MKKIIYAVLICVIIAGIVIIATLGLNADIIYSKNVQIDVYIGKIVDIKDIETRRKSAFECKGIFADIIDRIDNPGYYSSKITLKDISEKLKEASKVTNKNMEKFDKDKLPKDIF